MLRTGRQRIFGDEQLDASNLFHRSGLFVFSGSGCHIILMDANVVLKFKDGQGPLHVTTNFSRSEASQQLPGSV